MGSKLVQVLFEGLIHSCIIRLPGIGQIEGPNQNYKSISSAIEHSCCIQARRVAIYKKKVVLREWKGGVANFRAPAQFIKELEGIHLKALTIHPTHIRKGAPNYFFVLLNKTRNC